MSAEIEQRMAQLIEAEDDSMEANAVNAAKTFWEGVGYRKHDGTDQLGDCFNAILKGGSKFAFNVNHPTPNPVNLVDGEDSSHRTKCIAMVLYFIARKKEWIEGCGENPVRLGWDALNKDAQGWCRLVATSSIPKNLSQNALHDLLEARKWVFQITGFHADSHMKGRIAAVPFDRTMTGDNLE